MKCDKIRKEIDLLVYQESPAPYHEIFRHIESCRACSRYLEESRLAAGKIAGIRCREPLLRDPEELTESIMQSIRLSSESADIKHKDKVRKSRPVIVIQRLLAAASVCLCVVFGYEQYLVLDKISRLEQQNSAAIKSSRDQRVIQLDKAVKMIVASDREVLNQYKEIRSKKMLLSKLLLAAIYYDVHSISPDALKSQNRADYNITRSAVISVLKHLDSTYNTILR